MNNIGKTFVFKSNGEVFRIPALYYKENEKKLFGFTEKQTSRHDSSAVALVMSTGTPEEVVRKCPCGYRPMNPCTVYEKDTQTLFLFFNHVRLHYITKKNDDKWSEFTDLTDLLPTDNWSVGPGHGIQTESGRMIVPAYAYMKENNIPHSFYIYSDDKGSTWHYGAMLDKTSGECEMDEVSDITGDSLIYCNACNKGGFRVQAEIDESFHTFKSNTLLKELDKGCQGSVISFPAQPEDAETSQKKCLLFSHPTNQKIAWQRLDLGVYLSSSPVNSNGNCSGEWSQPWVINQRHSDGWFACLMECGEKSATDEIACQVFSYEELLLKIPWTRLNSKGDGAFSIAALILWNKLPFQNSSVYSL
uniref:exo-alpha-sialidase n=1 Tax=Poecilia mexicana TaxID=48701 RepID=A0A3B3YH29_9TELE